LKWFFTGGLYLLSGLVVAAPMNTGGLPFKPLLESPPIPLDNLQTKEKIELGKQLFFDPRLSARSNYSCNSCHNLTTTGDDGRVLSIGADGRVGTRNTPSLWNVAYQTVYHWDGAAATLEQEFMQHVVDPDIMGLDSVDVLLARLREIPAYREQFETVFSSTPITIYQVAQAVAAFERTLVIKDAPYDRYLMGDETAISDQAQRGFASFIEVSCASCHFWVNLAGPIPGLALQQGEGFYELFPNYPGTAYEQQYGLADDLGRYNLTGRKIDIRKWRMPGLRNIELTAPYFHNGSVADLDEAVRVMAKVQLHSELTDEQVADIVAFLKTLTSVTPTIAAPELPQ